MACGLFRHFGLTGEEAWPILKEYNDTCVPPWSDAELQHKVDDALTKVLAERERIGQYLIDRAKAGNEENGPETNASTHAKLVNLVRPQIELWYDQYGSYATVCMVESDTRDETSGFGTLDCERSATRHVQTHWHEHVGRANAIASGSRECS